jgi:hypothetical protein
MDALARWRAEQDQEATHRFLVADRFTQRIGRTWL